MISGRLFFVFGDDHALSLASHGDFVACLDEIFHFEVFGVASGGDERGFIGDVFEFCARSAWCESSDRIEVDVARNGFIFSMDFEDTSSPADVGAWDDDAAVESPGSEQSGVENVGAVCRRHDDDSVVRFKSVHFDEQLVEGLFAFVVPAAQSGAAISPNGIDFVDEDDASPASLCLIEELTDATCAHADEHFDEIRPRNAIERHASFAGNALGQ